VCNAIVSCTGASVVERGSCPCRFRVNMGHTRQSRPYSGRCVQIKVSETFHREQILNSSTFIWKPRPECGLDFLIWGLVRENFDCLIYWLSCMCHGTRELLLSYILNVLYMPWYVRSLTVLYIDCLIYAMVRENLDCLIYWLSYMCHSAKEAWLSYMLTVLYVPWYERTLNVFYMTVLCVQEYEKTLTVLYMYVLFVQWYERTLTVLCIDCLICMVQEKAHGSRCVHTTTLAWSKHCTGTSLIRNCPPVGPCSRYMRRALRWS
jgi:hypothetical protein